MKEQFKRLMSELISIKQDAGNLNTAFRKLDPEFNYISFGRYETLVVNSLEAAFKDKSQWISYYLYDCDCGKNPREVRTKTEKFKLKTLDQLWWLINNEE